MDSAAHLRSLFPEAQALDRRSLVTKTSLGAGFCAFIQPVFAQVITTPADGLVAGEVKVPSSGVDLPAYRAMPATGGPFPIVVVFNEIFGVHEHIKDVVRRFAKLGYFAIATDLFARAGDASAETDREKLMAIVDKASDAQVASDIDGTLAFARASGKADLSRTAIVGFCWGGRQVWLNAARHPEFKAAVAWYGPLGGPTSDAKPKKPIDILPALSVPILAFYGGKDTSIPQDQVEAMRAALKAAGKASEIVVYPDAQHGFHADYRPSYNKPDAMDSWAKATAWLKRHGV